MMRRGSPTPQDDDSKEYPGDERFSQGCLIPSVEQINVTQLEALASLCNVTDPSTDIVIDPVTADHPFILDNRVQLMRFNQVKETLPICLRDFLHIISSYMTYALFFERVILYQGITYSPPVNSRQDKLIPYQSSADDRVYIRSASTLTRKLQDQLGWWLIIYPHLVSCIIILEKSVVLVTPKLGEETLSTMIKQTEGLEDKTRILLAAGEELLRLHKQKIAHGDVHEHNIRLSKKGKIYIAEFIDFENTSVLAVNKEAYDVYKFCMMCETLPCAFSYNQNPELMKILSKVNEQGYANRIPLTIICAALKFELVKLTKNKGEADKLLYEVLATPDLAKHAKDLYDEATKLQKERVSAAALVKKSIQTEGDNVKPGASSVASQPNNKQAPGNIKF